MKSMTLLALAALLLHVMLGALTKTDALRLTVKRGAGISGPVDGTGGDTGFRFRKELNERLAQVENKRLGIETPNGEVKAVAVPLPAHNFDAIMMIDGVDRWTIDQHDAKRRKQVKEANEKWTASRSQRTASTGTTGAVSTSSSGSSTPPHSMTDKHLPNQPRTLRGAGRGSAWWVASPSTGTASTPAAPVVGRKTYRPVLNDAGYAKMLGKGGYGVVLIGEQTSPYTTAGTDGDYYTPLQVAMKFQISDPCKWALFDKEIRCMQRVSAPNSDGRCPRGHLTTHGVIRKVKTDAEGRLIHSDSEHSANGNGSIVLSQTSLLQVENLQEGGKIDTGLQANTVYDVIISDQMHGGELFDLIATNGSGRLSSEDTSRRIFADLVVALQHSHKLGIAHRDLKAENALLLRKDGKAANSHFAKLIDFGLAHEYQVGRDLDAAQFAQGICEFTKDVKHPTESCGSREYAAPEVLGYNKYSVYRREGFWSFLDEADPPAQGYDAFKADSWSLGSLLFAAHFGTHPFGRDSRPTQNRLAWIVERMQAKNEGSFVEKVAASSKVAISPELTTLLDSLLQFDPRSRPSMAEVLCSDWLRPAVPWADLVGTPCDVTAR